MVEKMPQGAIVFSLDKAKGLVWIAKEQSPIPVDEFVVVGPGRGGSHAVHQLAHAGITRYVIGDPDRVEILI